MLAESAKTGERHDGRNAPSVLESRDSTPRPTLAQIDVTRDQSSKWQQVVVAQGDNWASTTR